MMPLLRWKLKWKRTNAKKDDPIDLAMYSFWAVNQNVDIAFMEDEAEALLAKWKARWEEEKELRSITASGAIAGHDDIGGEVSSQSLKLTGSKAALPLSSPLI